MFIKPKKHLKFLIKVTFSDDEAVLNKLSPILNQLSIDDSSNIDDLLFSFFTQSYDPAFAHKRTTAKVYFTIWKNRNIYNHLKIKPFLFHEYILKYKQPTHRRNWLVSGPHLPFSFGGGRRRRDLFSSVYGLAFGLLESSFWSVITGYQFFLNKIEPAFHVYHGIAYSYRHRAQMLGRKINFRRRFHEKKFEDY